MKKSKIVLFIKLTTFLLIISGSSCKKFLDVDPYINDMFNLDTVFSKKTFAERYLYTLYNNIPDEGQFVTAAGVPWVGASDEAVWTWKRSDIPAAYYASGEYDPALSYYNYWKSLYQGVRSTNIFLARADEVKDMNQSEKQQLKAQARFLRGYFYYCLVMQYGPVILLPEKPLEFDEQFEALLLPRNTYDECIDYISTEMTAVAEELPLTQDPSWIGRPTKGAALAVKARLLLQAASPQFNGNTAYANFVNKNGVPFINQTYSEEKWAKAAAAAKEVIDLGIYKLYTVAKNAKTAPIADNVSTQSFPNGAGDIDPFLSYRDLFTGGTLLSSMNPEAIFVRSKTDLNTSILFAMPKNMAGWNGAGITQKQVDAYMMKDGRTIQNSSTQYPYQENGFSATADAFTSSGTSFMYINREPRFYASVGYNGAFWEGTSATLNPAKNFTAEYYFDGNEGRGSDVANYPLSGYVIRKYIHPEDNNAYGGGSTRTRKTYMLFRLAEVYLNYVEAMNELSGTYSVGSISVSRDIAQIKTYFNQIRFRAGLPALAEQEVTNVNQLRTIIQRERQVELAFEGRRFFDTKRWKIAEVEENMPVIGMDIMASRANKQQYFTRTVVKDAIRSFNFKQYLWPIPRTDIIKNKELIQNPGW
jgi:hypothetical protein